MSLFCFVYGRKISCVLLKLVVNFWMLYSGHIGVLVNMYIVLIFILKAFVEYFIY